MRRTAPASRHVRRASSNVAKVMGHVRVKRLLLSEDYDSVLTVARDQMDGGAHLLDVCVALTERSDEADQMVVALRKRQVPVEYMLLADEGHGLVRRDNLIAYLARSYRFVADHLGLPAGPAAQAR